MTNRENEEMMHASILLGVSHEQAKKRFGSEAAARKYPAEYRAGVGRDEREKRAILRALRYVPEGARVLDLPCGTGRGARLLLQNGFSVIAADISTPMVEQARRNLRVFRNLTPGEMPEVSFMELDAAAIDLPDDTVDAVFCNRLFHHFTEPGTRLCALAELRRVSRGPVIVSFFNAFACDAVYRGLRNRLLGRRPADRIPVPMSRFQAEVEASGFQVREKIAVRWGVSPLCFVVVE